MFFLLRYFSIFLFLTFLIIFFSLTFEVRSNEKSEIDQEIRFYLLTISKELNKIAKKSYPENSIKKKEQGTIKVEVEIDNFGEIIDLKFENTKPDNLYKATKKIFEIYKFPKPSKQFLGVNNTFRIKIPIHYRLKESDDISGKKLLCDNNQNPEGKTVYADFFTGYHFLDDYEVLVYMVLRREKPSYLDEAVEFGKKKKVYHTSDSYIFIHYENSIETIDRTDTYCEVYNGDLKLFFEKKTNELEKFYEKFKSRRKI